MIVATDPFAHATSRQIPVIRAEILSWIWLLISLSALVAALADEHQRDLPLHSHIADGDQGWACDKPFQQVGRSCVIDPAAVASKRLFEIYDNGWRCISGYRSSGGYCVPISLPPHARPVGRGGAWECESGYKREESRCELVIVPPNAHLDASGHAWECDAGFRVLSQVCIPATSDTVQQ